LLPIEELAAHHNTPFARPGLLSWAVAPKRVEPENEAGTADASTPQIDSSDAQADREITPSE
jgi:hypothetical protein